MKSPSLIVHVTRKCSHWGVRPLGIGVAIGKLQKKWAIELLKYPCHRVVEVSKSKLVGLRSMLLELT